MQLSFQKPYFWHLDNLRKHYLAQFDTIVFLNMPQKTI